MKLFDSKMLVFLGIKGLFNKCLLRTFCHSFRYIWREISAHFAFVFCKIIYIWNILILKEHQALVSLVCMFDCDVPKNSEARINITRPKILLKHDL